MNIITLVPTRGLILTETQESVERELIMNHQVPTFLRSWDMPLPMSRNYLTEAALKLEWTHALLLDDDVILPEGSLKKLIDLNTDIAIMDYPMHTMKNGKHVGTTVTDKDKSIAWSGLGSVLVKREVFEKMPQPWFVFTNYKISRDDSGNIGFFGGQEDGQNKFSGGEDVYFYLQARKLGFKMKQIKECSVHAHIEHFVSPVQNGRYQLSHKIIKRDKIEGEIL